MLENFTLPRKKRRYFKSIYDFTIGERIGEGSFSEVFLATNKITNLKYAIKKIDLNKIKAVEQENIQKEIEIHSILHHPNIITLYDYFVDKNNIYIILEYLAKGNLYDHLQNNDDLTEEDVVKYFKQTCRAVRYLHQKDIIMRDIKPENILLTKNGDIKICDFGWASFVNDEDYSKLRAGTFIYMSPEALEGNKQTFSSDIWSLGVLLYEFYYGKEPFLGFSLKHQLHKVKEGIKSFGIGIFGNVDYKVQQLIRECFKYKSEYRPDIEDILNNPLFQSKNARKERKSGIYTLSNKKDLLNLELIDIKGFKEEKRFDGKKDNVQKKLFDNIHFKNEFKKKKKKLKKG